VRKTRLKSVLWVLVAVCVLLLLFYLRRIALSLSAGLEDVITLVFSVAFPLIGGYFLLKFGYSLFLRPYLRLRRMERLRNRRAWQEAARLDNERRR
jgi:hypothetical protein